MAAQIFSSYRRSDADGHAGRLYDRLAQWFDVESVFYDREGIDSGDVFSERLRQGINDAEVVLVLIAPGWLAEINRRAPPDTDWVRHEVELALSLHGSHGRPRVVPVLMGGASLPTADTLHEHLRDGLGRLLQFDAHEFRGKNDDWDNQFVRLRNLLAAVPGVPAPRYRPPPDMVAQPFRTIENLLSPHFQDPNDALGQLQATLTATGRAAVVARAAVSGMGGAGKTQLALKYSHEFRDRYAGVWWFRAETDDTLQFDARECCMEVGAAIIDVELPTRTLKRWIANQSEPWLLVFDNAQGVEPLRPHLPDAGPHHVLITSCNPAWGGVAKPVETVVWTPEQGAAFLADRLPTASLVGRVDLARALGGLPLALEQAAAYLEQTGSALRDYIGLTQRYETAALVLDEGTAATGYERSVFATLSIAFDRLSPAAQALLRLCAFFAPEPIPGRLFQEGMEHLPDPLSEAVLDPIAWKRIVAELIQYGLASPVTLPSLTASGVQKDELALLLHRLTQEVTRWQISDGDADAAVVLSLLYGATRIDASVPAHWPLYARLAPHVHQLDALSNSVKLDPGRHVKMLDRIASYQAAGPALFAVSRSLFERAVGLAGRAFGEEHPDTLTSMSNLALTLGNQGDLNGARALQEQVLEARRRVLGEEHPDTLT